MKKIVLGIFVMATVCLSFTTEGSDKKENAAKNSTTYTASNVAGKITLINDTSDKLSVHTGSGSVTLNKGGKTSFSCNIGKKVKVDGDVIFTIDDDFCGEIVYLSKYL